MVHADKGERGKHPEVLLTSSMDARLRSERYFVLIFVEVAAHAQTTVRTDDGPLGLSPTRRPPPTGYRLPNLINCRLPTLSNRGDKLSIIKYGFSLAQYSTGGGRYFRTKASMTALNACIYTTERGQKVDRWDGKAEATGQSGGSGCSRRFS